MSLFADNFQGECDDGWLKYDDHCIKAFAEELVKYSDAEEQCNIQHGHLAGVPSSNTQVGLHMGSKIP